MDIQSTSCSLIQNLLQKVPFDLEKDIQWFKSAFDYQEAIDRGNEVDSSSQDNIIVRPGFEENYDEAEKQIQLIEQRFEEYRQEQSRKLG